MPLPLTLRNSLIAVTTLAFLSFISTALLVLYVTYPLIKWDRVAHQPLQQNIAAIGNQQSARDGSNDLTLGLEERHYHYLKMNGGQSPPVSEPPTPRLEKRPYCTEEKKKKDTRWNPVLMLIHNLLCANLMEAMAFILGAEWLRQGGILVSTAACWAQGWFMQVGKLSCSGMLVLISKSRMYTLIPFPCHQAISRSLFFQQVSIHTRSFGVSGCRPLSYTSLPHLSGSSLSACLLVAFWERETVLIMGASTQEPVPG